MAKQRRGKDVKAAPPAAAAAAAAAAAQQQLQQQDETNEQYSVEVQIQKAKDAVNQSRATVVAMHIQWRTHLLRLSYMVVLITLHQWQGPITSCLHDVKSYNKSLTPLDSDSLRLSGLQAIYYVVQDTFCEMLGFFMGILLVLFLNQTNNEAAVTLMNTATGTTAQDQGDSFFTNKLYMVATGLVPPLINLYFTHSGKQQQNGNDTAPSCLDHSSVASLSGGSIMWTRYAAENTVVRGFPVVIIFHTMATACCWFMAMQQSQQNKNINMLENLRKELTTARAEAKTKKKA